MKARSLSNQCDFCSEDVLSDLSAKLQLLPLKLKIVGKELCEVACVASVSVKQRAKNGVFGVLHLSL